MDYSRFEILKALILPLILVTVVTLYWPARTGGSHFDDRGNLGDLASVVDRDSALRFIFAGDAGPLGRPLALASFSLQAYAWPEHSEVFLQTNILLHILNGALLAWCLLWFGRFRGMQKRDAYWTAVLGSAFWLTIPLLASSSLFIVQRMTTLSATFMLAGLLGYLAARVRLAESPRKMLAGMSASVVLGTGLAVLSKENGALLPVLVLVIELTLAPASIFRTSSASRLWGWLFLVGPLIVLLGFMASRLPYSEQAAMYRGFSAGQRLWTEAEILWMYLFHAFVPIPSQLAPFHDHLKASPSLFQPVTLVAVAAWVVVTGLALRLRPRLPLFAFAVFWYLGAHLLESTVLNLELYFAHRNYIALIGPVYAVTASVWNMKPGAVKVARSLLTGYILILAGSLFYFTSLWGQAALAAEMWAIHRPDSVRSNLHLVYYLHKYGYYRAALRTLDQIYAHNPERHPGVGVEALTIACALHPDRDHAKRAEDLLAHAENISLDAELPENLVELQRLLLKTSCRGVSFETVERLALQALENRAYARSHTTLHNLYTVLIELAIADHDFNRTMTYIEKSLRIRPSLEGLHLALEVLIDAGRPDLGQAFIDMTRRHLPKQPIQQIVWNRQLALFEKQLESITDNQTTRYSGN
ncbi:MAG TPA: hypothetical protein VF268_05310 [Gammaproteobacteria bacterium]